MPQRAATAVRSATAVVVLALGVAPGALAQHWHGSLAATSDYVFRGVTQTQGDAAVQADLHYEATSGAFAGAWMSTIDPGFDAYGQVELDAYVGWSRPLSADWTSRLSYVRYLYPDANGGIDYDYGDFVARLGWRDRAAASLAWSPDTLRFGEAGYTERGNAWAVELALRQPFGRAWAANLGAGYYRQPADIEYGSWSVGLTWQAGPFEVDLSRFATGDGAGAVLSPAAARDRWSLSALWRF